MTKHLNQDKLDWPPLRTWPPSTTPIGANSLKLIETIDMRSFQTDVEIHWI